MSAKEPPVDESWRDLDIYAPTPEHALVARTVREFTESAQGWRPLPILQIP